MKILIASEFRCTLCNNKYYLAPKAFTIYKRYAYVFGIIDLCCRVEKKDFVLEGYKEAIFIDKVVEIDSLLNVLLGKSKKIMIQEIRNCDLVIARIPSMIAYKAADYARIENKPYFAELMGDAWDSYWNHDFWGKCIALYMDRKMRKITWDSNYSLYVTDKYLQYRYPSKNQKSINASNVVINEVNEEILRGRLNRIDSFDKTSISLMTTAAVDVKPKGQQYVIKAMKTLKESGINVTYYLAGGGNQDFLKKIARKEGVKSQVVFLGELTIRDVYKYIDIADIYIQPSLQEGLPRSVIEAMSRGCPCVGSKTAGTPELIEEEYTFKRSSSDAIVESINYILSRDLKKIAMRNFEFAKKYKNEFLDKRRNEFFYRVKKELEDQM